MTRVVVDISMSLDGFVTGPDPGPGQGLGLGGEAIHTWATDPDAVDAAVLRDATARSGAVLMGRRLFDVVDGPHGWNDEMGYGASEVGTPAFVVVTHSPPEQVRLGLDFTFVGGVDAALQAARRRAGGRDVVVMGGADVVRQVLDAGEADEVSLHIAPVVLGGGTPLFAGSLPCSLVQRDARVSSHAVHATYEVRDQ